MGNPAYQQKKLHIRGKQFNTSENDYSTCDSHASELWNLASDLHKEAPQTTITLAIRTAIDAR